MSDERENPKSTDGKEQPADENGHELTFEHGHGAQERVVPDEKDLADVAGVTEADVREDLLTTQQDDEDAEPDKGGA